MFRKETSESFFMSSYSIRKEDLTPSFLLECIKLAFMIDVSINKPGNVGPNHPVDNVSHLDYLDFIEKLIQYYNSLFVGEWDSSAQILSLGEIILQSVKVMVGSSERNLSLGSLLLISPLIHSVLFFIHNKETQGDLSWEMFWKTVQNVLIDSLPEDVIKIVQAIRLSNPGGTKLREGFLKLSREEYREIRYDLWDPLLEERIQKECLSLRDLFFDSADFDSISYEYVSIYKLTRELCQNHIPSLKKKYCIPSLFSLTPEERLSFISSSFSSFVLELFFQILVLRPDSLIIRKSGREAARALSEYSRLILSYGINSSVGKHLIENLGCVLWDSNGLLNPGTTADLLVVSLFISLLFSLL